jgi:hypothetical protein
VNLRRHWVKSVIVAVIAVSAVAYTVGRLKHRDASPDPRTINPEQVTSLKIKIPLYDPETSDPTEFTLTSRDQINAILACVRSARPTSRHRCVGRGDITLALADGRHVEFQILPGHDTSSYEFRTGSARTYFKMQREPFVSAMASAGIKRSLLLTDFDERPTSREP